LRNRGFHARNFLKNRAGGPGQFEPLERQLPIDLSLAVLQDSGGDKYLLIAANAAAEGVSHARLPVRGAPSGRC
jgi:hypothetical protein